MKSVVPAAKATIALLAGLGCVIALGLIAWSTWADYRDSHEAAEILSRQAVRLVEEHAQRYFAAPDQAIQRVIDRLSDRQLAGLGHEDWQALRDIEASLPQISGLFVHDAAGKLALSSRDFPTPDEDYSDRDYRRAHMRGETGLYVGPLIKSKARKDSGNYRFTISRPILRDGKYAGLVVAAVDVAFFQSFYDSLNLGTDSICLVLQMNGNMVVRQRVLDEELNRNFAHTPLFTEHLAKAPNGTYRRRGGSDGIERIYSYRAIAGLPLVAMAGVAVETALAEWHGRLWRNIAAALALALIVLAAGRRAWLASEREAMARTEADRARAMAERASDAKSRFLASASHDLRQPFQAMRLFHEVLIVQVQGSPAQIAAERLGEAMQAGEDLLTNLLHISTLDAGMVRVNRECFPVNEVVDQVVSECEPQAKAKGIVIAGAPANLRVNSDRVLLGRIVRNLMVNAIRYTEKGSISLRFDQRGEYLAIQVADTGIGIPDDKLELIFEDFYQVDNPARDRAQGLGLGLSIVARTSRLLDHPVEVRSQPGHGSVFSILVPLAPAVDEPA